MTADADSGNCQEHVQAWLDGERGYAERKWTPGMTDEIPPDDYKRWVGQYMHRATVLGLDNPLGRQALAKALRTLLAFTESTVRQYGQLPPPGVPSGEVTDA